jgi:fatty-acyl-CoA synthase
LCDDGTLAPTDGKPWESFNKGAWTVSSYFKTNNQESFTKDGWFKTGDVSNN